MPSTIRGSDNFDSAGGNAVKAWVNFNGTGTVAIRAAFNVSSITDNGTGDYTVNFTSALSDANYCMASSAGGSASSSSYLCIKDNATPTTTSCRVSSNTTNGSAAADQTICNAAFLR